MNNLNNIFSMFSVLNNNNNYIIMHDISNNENDIDNILVEALNESFDLINDYLQQKIVEEELYIRSYYFDDNLIADDLLYRNVIKNVIFIGLANRYDIKLLSANLFAYLCINNISISNDAINESIKSSYIMYRRRYVNRRGIFMNLINQIIDPLNQQVVQGNAGEEIRKLSQEEFNKLKCYKFKDKEHLESKCSICNDEYEKEDEIVELPCSSHYFHKECINEWTVNHHASCPLCRTNIEL